MPSGARDASRVALVVGVAFATAAALAACTPEGLIGLDSKPCPAGQVRNQQGVCENLAGDGGLGEETAPTGCEQAGGVCLARGSSACQGFFSEEAGLGCGATDNVACCLPNQQDSGTPDGSPPPNACETAGGACVTIAPSACTDGAWADADILSCGDDPGVGCCLPQPDAGDDADVDADTDADMDADAGQPSLCLLSGGECVVVEPQACPSGHWDLFGSCGTTLGLGCCLPGPGDEVTVCEAAGGECVGVTPTSCTGGFVGDMDTYPCGPGIGVECCFSEEPSP